MERPKNERGQAENIKMHRTRCVPAANKNKQADEEVQQTDHPKVVFGGEGLFRGGRYHRRLELFSIARKLVENLGPQSRTVKVPSNFRCSRNGNFIKCEQEVAGSDGSVTPGGVGGNVSRLDTMFGVDPGDAVKDLCVAGALVKV